MNTKGVIFTVLTISIPCLFRKIEIFGRITIASYCLIYGIEIIEGACPPYFLRSDSIPLEGEVVDSVLVNVSNTG